MLRIKVSEEMHKSETNKTKQNKTTHMHNTQEQHKRTLTAFGRSSTCSMNKSSNLHLLPMGKRQYPVSVQCPSSIPVIICVQSIDRSIKMSNNYVENQVKSRDA